MQGEGGHLKSDNGSSPLEATFDAPALHVAREVRLTVEPLALTDAGSATGASWAAVELFSGPSQQPAWCEPIAARAVRERPPPSPRWRPPALLLEAWLAVQQTDGHGRGRRV
jgi:hypothetical protein